MKLELYEVREQEDIDFFWQKRDQYMQEDIIPNCTLGEPLTDEDKEWFLSEAYKKHIMTLFQREIDPLHILFFIEDKTYMGFAVYVLYESEDGKCFIIDYCMDPKSRNNGKGKCYFQLLEEKFRKEGATYVALNLSNERNEKFWLENGFFKTSKDEYGNYIYKKELLAF